MLAKIARFYGWSFAEVNSLTMDQLWPFWLAITVIESEETSLNVRASNFSNLKPKDQNNFSNSLDRGKRLLENKQQGDAESYDGIKNALLGIING